MLGKRVVARGLFFQEEDSVKDGFARWQYALLLKIILNATSVQFPA